MHGQLSEFPKKGGGEKHRPESGRMRKAGLERVAERRVLSCQSTPHTLLCVAGDVVHATVLMWVKKYSFDEGWKLNVVESCSFWPR